MKEIIVTYNSKALEQSGLESIVTHASEHTMHVSERIYGVEQHSMIATYRTSDPHALIENLERHYGHTIRYIEESGERQSSNSEKNSVHTRRS